MNTLKAILIIGASYGAAFASNVPLVFRLAYAITAIVLVCFFWSRRSAGSLDVERMPRELRAQVGQTIAEALSLRNRSLLPNFYSEILDRSTLPGHTISQAFSLMPRASTSVEVSTSCHERGKFTLGPFSIVVADPFGLFKWQKTYLRTWTVVVYPSTHDLPHFQLSSGDLIGGQSLRQRTFFITPSVSGIREYAPGDGLNRIHWPSTAKARRLMTKEFELDPASDVWIALDLQRGVQFGSGRESTTEYGVTVAASLAKHFIDQNRSVGIVAFGEHHSVIHSDRGGRQLLKVLEELAVTRAEGHWPFMEVLAAEELRFGRNTTLIAVSPSTDESWARALEHVAQRGARSIAVHLEASTFGEARNSMLLIGTLAAANIPTFVIKKGDRIGDILCLSS